MIQDNRQHPDANPQDGQFSSGVELLSKALKTVFVISATGIILMLAWFLSCGGSFIVDSTAESVIVLKFGKYHNTYHEGWHWFMPYPVNKVIRIDTRKQQLRTMTFMPANVAKLYNPNEKADGMMQDTLAPGRDGYVLLGDNAIMHCEWIMWYKISDPTRYFLNCVSPETSIVSEEHGPDETRLSPSGANAMLKSILNDAVIAVSAALDIENTYYAKAQYEQAVRERMSAAIEALDIGIALESLNLQIVAPPIKTQQAFQLLLLSEETSKRQIAEAQTSAVELVNTAANEAAELQANASAYRSRIISEVQADANYFKELLIQYRKNPSATLVSLYATNLADAMAPVREKFVISSPKIGADQTLWLKLNQDKSKQKPAGAGKDGHQ